MGMPGGRVIGSGGHEKDVEMWQGAGLGLAMGNGMPAVQAIADAVIPSVD